MVDPIMEIAEAYKKPVFIHCGHPPYSLPWQIGLLAERHPHVPTVMIHMGHGHGVYIEGSLNMAYKYDNLFLEVSGMRWDVRSKMLMRPWEASASCSVSIPRSIIRV